MLKVDYKKVQGCKQPPETEKTPHNVYLRRNIRQIENDEGNTLYEYEEACLTLEEYAEYEAETSNPMLATIMQKQNELQLQIYQLMAKIGG